MGKAMILEEKAQSLGHTSYNILGIFVRTGLKNRGKLYLKRDKYGSGRRNQTV
jgi:hypothetical protein